MSKLTPAGVLLGALGLGIGVAGVVALREATLSTHEAVSARWVELVLSAEAKGGETSQSLDEMVEAQLLMCRLEVSSDLSEPIESLGDGQYRAVLAPALDQTNRRQFRGCVEDWVIDHVKLDIVEMNEIE